MLGVWGEDQEVQDPRQSTQSRNEEASLESWLPIMERGSKPTNPTRKNECFMRADSIQAAK